MDRDTLDTFDASLNRCNANPAFLDRFYDIFLASSPKVRAKFENTDFVRQKRALRASLYLMPLAADEKKHGPERYLRDLAARHSRGHLDIGADFYDLWLDSLLATVRECDPECSRHIEKVWEDVMSVGIAYLVAHYNEPPKNTVFD